MKDEDFSSENLKKLNYIDCVEKEVTRYYEPVNQILLEKCRKTIT